MTTQGPENEDGSVSPAWGALPAEQYLIRNWDWESTDSPTVQRLKLVRQFLKLSEEDFGDLDVLGFYRSGWSRHYRHQDQWPGLDTIAVPRPPSSREIEGILKPWRPIRLRRVAVQYWMNIWEITDEATWLRTYYGPGSDEVWQEFIETEEEYNPRFEDTLSVRLLSDVSCFNLGDDWELLFDLLPEVRGNPPRDTLGRDLEDHHKKLKQLLQPGVPGNESIQGRDQSIITEVMHLQAACYIGYLIVADKEAFQTGKLRLIFYDRTSNIVRHGRIPVEDAHMVTAYQFQGRITEQYWTDWAGTFCPLGDKYTLDGEFGCYLYDLGDAALTQKLRDVMISWWDSSED